MILQNKYISWLVFLICCKFVLSECPRGYFKLNTMKYCVPLLNCEDISRLTIKNLIGFGSTKDVYRALWGKYNVSLVSLRDLKHSYDFHYGLYILKTLSPNEYIVKLLGFCEEKNNIVIEYHKNNNALNFNQINKKFSLKESFNFCHSYSKIVYFLHNSPIGVLVNCDSNDLTKLLSQLLITNEYNLVLADVDALPEVKTNSSIVCGPKEIKSDFVAPEQLWKGPEKFNTKFMKGYNEKTDIWKVPNVCLFFLQRKYVELLQYKLFDIHLQCKTPNPLMRPLAKELLYKYEEILISL